MKRVLVSLTGAALLTAGAFAFLLPVRSLDAYLIGNWWNDATNIVMDDVFLPAATWSSPAQFQLSEWNEVDTTDNSHPFRISTSPEFSFGANDGDNTMGFLGESGLNSEYGLSYAAALAWTACWSSGTIVECDVMLDPSLPWNLSPDDDEFFQSTVLHETGHVRGLDHYNGNLSMQNSGVNKILREDLYMDDKVAVRQHASHVAETDIIMYNKWHNGSTPQWMTMSPTTARVGETVLFNNLKVENRGTTAFGSLRFGIYFSTNDLISTGDTLVNTGTFGSFGTFTQSTFNWSGVVPSVTDCGSRWFGSIIDDNGAYAERYEGNNNVTFVNGTPTPQALSILLERDGLEPNDSFAAPRTIFLPINNGNLTIDQDLEQDFYRFTLAALSRVTFTASFTHSLGDVDMDLRNSANAVLQSSAGTSNSETITADLAAGTYYIRVFGFNAGSCNRYSLTGSSVLLIPDIAVSPTSWAYGNVAVGSTSDKIFVVSNTGNTDLNVSATSLVGTNANQFSIQSGGGAFTLAPAATRNVTVRFAPTSIGAKTASLRFASNDPDENPLDVALTGTGIQLPDLVVSALTAPALAAPGTVVNLANTVGNTGAANAGAFTVGFYLSTDTTCTVADTFLTSRNIASLAAGATNAVNTPVTIPAATPFSTRYFCAIADTGGAQTETSEVNNTAFRAVSVVSPVPIVTLKVNGLHPTPPVVSTPGPMLLTLDISPSTWTTPADWYWAIVSGSTVLWVTPGGISTTPGKLVTAVPGTLTNVPLLDITLPSGTSLTNVFFLQSGTTTLSLDSITTNVE
jgi:CARDB/Cep192 domain 4/Bacterial pre-peptidase C-terminal domain